MVNKIKSVAFNKLAETVGAMPTGWEYQPAFEGTKQRSPHPERVLNTVWHDGSKYTVEARVNGTVIITVTTPKDFKKYEGAYFTPYGSPYKLEFDSLDGLIETVKEMINDENAKDFTKALDVMQSANGLTYKELKVQEAQAEPANQPDTTKSVIGSEPKGFWARLFGG